MIVRYINVHLIIIIHKHKPVEITGYKVVCSDYGLIMGCHETLHRVHCTKIHAWVLTE